MTFNFLNTYTCTCTEYGALLNIAAIIISLLSIIIILFYFMRYCIVGNSGGMKFFLGIKLQIFY